jgi:hypothetical protein
MAPGVFVLHQKQPHIVIRPIFDGRIDQRVGQIGVGREPLADASFIVFGHRACPPLAFGLSRAEHENRLAVFAHHIANKPVRWVDFEPFGTPAKEFSRRRVAAADQIDPKARLGLGMSLCGTIGICCSAAASRILACDANSQKIRV